jgi:archaeosine synthase
MLEILGRDGLARSGEWRAPEGVIRLPNVLFYSGDRVAPPDEAEAILSRAPARSGRPALSYGGSVFFPIGDGSSSIPPVLGLPQSIDRLNELAMAATAKDGRAAVVHHSPSEPLGKDLVVMGNAVELLRRPYDFAERIVALRRAAGHIGVLYVPGIASPANLPLLAYCGADLVDSLRTVMDSRAGRYYSGGESEGNVREPTGTCACDSCRDPGEGWLLRHNLSELHRELTRVRRTVARGRLRELVERRAAADAWMVSVLRHMDRRFHEHCEAHAPMTPSTIRAFTEASLTRPEVVRFRRRMVERYRPPEAARVLLLLPCSARKPYSLSRSHSILRRAVKESGNPGVVHEVVVTSPLGIVPRELEVFPPAQHYDVPVTGDWSLDEREEVARGVERLLDAGRYDAVVAHFEGRWLEEVVPDAVFTSAGRPTSGESVRRLREALREACAGLERVAGHDRLVQNLRSLARFQFGPAGEAVVEGCSVRGRYPNLRLWRDDAQVAMLVGRRGMLSLTMAGAEALVREAAYVVGIDDFEVEGNVFAVGVEGADSAIRIGDDVAVAHDGDLRAVGVAKMTPGEMVESSRGEAVRVRHKRSR